jgi:hypothetical protein
MYIHIFNPKQAMHLSNKSASIDSPASHFILLSHHHEATLCSFQGPARTASIDLTMLRLSDCFCSTILGLLRASGNMISAT